MWYTIGSVPCRWGTLQVVVCPLGCTTRGSGLRSCRGCRWWVASVFYGSPTGRGASKQRTYVNWLPIPPKARGIAGIPCDMHQLPSLPRYRGIDGGGVMAERISARRMRYGIEWHVRTGGCPRNQLSPCRDVAVDSRCHKW